VQALSLRSFLPATAKATATARLAAGGAGGRVLPEAERLPRIHTLSREPERPSAGPITAGHFLSETILLSLWQALKHWRTHSDDITTAKRRQKLLPSETFDDDLPAYVESTPETVHYSLAGFTDDERILLVTFAESMDFATAAAELGISPSALRSRLQRLKKRKAARWSPSAAFVRVEDGPNFTAVVHAPSESMPEVMEVFERYRPIGILARFYGYDLATITGSR
jgi:hypothetical protein